MPANAGDVRETGSISGSGRSSGGRNGNPLQYSCLENPMDREAWQATVYGVTKRWTRLKWLSMRVQEGKVDSPRLGASLYTHAKSQIVLNSCLIKNWPSALWILYTVCMAGHSKGCKRRLLRRKAHSRRFQHQHAISAWEPGLGSVRISCFISLWVEGMP